MYISRAKCLKLRLSTPLGPVMVTTRALTEALISFGILTHWLELIVLMFTTLKQNTRKTYYNSCTQAFTVLGFIIKAIDDPEAHIHTYVEQYKTIVKMQ